MIGLYCNSILVFRSEIQKFVFSRSFTSSPVRSKGIYNSKEGKICYVYGSLVIVTKSGKIPTLGAMGHSNLFLNTFKLYGIHL